MSAISFTVPSVPVAQPRQRHAIFAGHVRNYIPTKHKVTAFKATCKLAFRQEYQGPPLAGPLRVLLTFVMPRPARLVWKKRPMPRANHTSAPDIDNLVKSVFDALNELAFLDDKQICDLRVTKCHAAGDEQPAVHVTITELDGKDAT